MKTKTFLCHLASLVSALALVESTNGATNFVSVQGFTFQPSSLTVSVGDTVMFSDGAGFHTVTGDGAEPFCGTAFFTSCSVTFSNLGDFGYHCTVHQSLNMTGVVHVVALAATSPLSILIHGDGNVTPNLDGQALIIGNNYTVTAHPASGHVFAGWTGGITSSTARLTFTMQSNLMLEANFSTLPGGGGLSAAITSPRAGAHLASNNVTVTGTARGDEPFVVEYRLESATQTNDYQTAEGTTNWSAALNNLSPGSYRVRVRARDESDNLSREVTRSFQVQARLVVTLEDEDDGTVTRGLAGTTYHDVGRRLSILANPRSGYLFAGWTGDIVTNANPLTFIIRSNTEMQATFADNPFIAIKGSYNGLFYVSTPTNLVRHESSGAFTFALTDRGRYSGTLQLAGKRRPFSGTFGLDGKATNVVKLPGPDTVSMELMLDLHDGTQQVMGSILDTNADWTATMLGDRAPSYPGDLISPYKGRYTLLLEAESDSQPRMGTSYGTVVVNRNGKLTFIGNLADNTPVAQNAIVSSNGFWPLYLALYGGRGSLLSWVEFDTNASPTPSLYGDVSWIKPTLTSGRFYRDGFTNSLDLVGSIYDAPAQEKVLQIDTGSVLVWDGNLSQTFSNSVSLSANNKVTNLTSSQPLVLNISRPTGLFSGSVIVMDGEERKKLSFKGSVLQRQNYGAGFFLGVDATGTVRFESVP